LWFRPLEFCIFQYVHVPAIVQWTSMNYAFTKIYERKRIFIQILTVEVMFFFCVCVCVCYVVRGTGPLYEGFRLRALRVLQSV